MRIEHWLYTLPLRLRSLFRRRKVEQELDEELRFHIERKTEEGIARGLTPEEARYAAMRAMEGVEQRKEECRDRRRVNWMNDLLQDLRYALRGFMRTPGFAATVIVTLGLGIGANTAVFSLVDAVLLKTLPVREPDKLINVIRPDPASSGSDGASLTVPYPVFRRMSDRTTHFADLFTDEHAREDIVKIDGASEERVRHQAVSGNYFAVLGVQPINGRTITPEDDREPGQHPVAVISYELWERRFHSDPEVIGHKIHLRSNMLEIVGVAPRGFFGIEVGTMVDLWTPTSMEPADRLANLNLGWLRINGRLKPGVTREQAAGPIQAVWREFLLDDIRRTAPPGTSPHLIEQFLSSMASTKVVPAGKGISSLRKQYGQPLQIVMTVVVLVLLISCTNVANLLLARASTRRREMAVRLSLGAARTRLFRQMLTENLLLAALAASFGLLFAHWVTPLLVRLLAPSNAPVQLALRLDARLLGFTVAASLLAVLLFGLLPALRSSKMDIHTELRSGARLTGSNTRTGKGLVVCQVSLSLVLIVGAVLFVRTLINLLTSGTGFNSQNLIVARLQFRGQQSDERLRVAWEELRGRIRSIPGVQSESLSEYSLFSGNTAGNGVRILNSTEEFADPVSNFLQISTDFFRTTGTRVLQGRDFERRDFDPTSLPVAIVNQTMARKFFGEKNPIGRKLTRAGDNPPRWMEVVGVAQDAKLVSLRDPAPPLVYEPYTQAHSRPQPIQGHIQPWMSLEVQGHLDTASLANALRREANPEFIVHEISPQNKLIDDTLIRERLLANVASFFGLLALLLAAVGLYGIMSYAVTQRTPEIGIRMALGAPRSNVLGMVMRDSLLIVLAGAAIGLAGAMALTRYLATLLYGLAPHDPATFFIAVAILLMAALMAAYIPALRASRIDPMAALRHE